MNPEPGTVFAFHSACGTTLVMSRIAAMLIVLGLYALHQDVWFWNDATPLVFGVLPIGLAYHVAYTIVTAAVMVVLVRTCWPQHLDRETTNE